MKKVFLVHGMKRSGNHAVINWLLPHDQFVFFNNVIEIIRVLAGKTTIPAPTDYTT